MDFYEIFTQGYVKLIDRMGEDSDIAKSARVSYNNQDAQKSESEDERLIRYLMNHQHTSPFEMIELKFEIRMPIFIARQWLRHRTANINEYSGRYSELKCEFYVPEIDMIKSQNNKNKQGSDGEVSFEIKEKFLDDLTSLQNQEAVFYHWCLENGISREMSRINLPLDIYTTFIFKIDLHNLFHFLKLRLDSHAQYEIRVFAEAVEKIVAEKYPKAYQAWCDYVKNAVKFSAIEKELLNNILYNITEKDLQMLGIQAKQSKLTANEILDFTKKLNISSENIEKYFINNG